MVEDRGARRERAGVLRDANAEARVEIGRAEPPAGLSEYVDYLWWVGWEAPQPQTQQTIPRPVVHVFADEHEGEARLLVSGPLTDRFDYEIHGTGRTVAAAFRPGGFHPYLGGAVSGLRDRTLPIRDVLGIDDRAIAAEVLATEPIEGAAIRLATWLAAIEVDEDPEVGHLAALVEYAEGERSVIRAEQLADRAGVSLRTLQRRFDEYVGVGPKWVVQRFRLLDAAEAAHADTDVDWAGLAGDLGYADQSHLIRAFTRLVGSPPATYARRATIS